MTQKKERHGPPLMQKAHNVKRDTQFISSRGGIGFETERFIKNLQ